LALTLKELRTRDFDGDGHADHPDATVADALSQYGRTIKTEVRQIEADRIYAAWDGEWSRFSNQTNQVIPMNHDASKLVTIPEGISEIELTMTFTSLSAEERSVVSLYTAIDMDGDGSPDWQQSGSPLASARTDVIPVSESDWGSTWSVNVEGRGINWKLGDRIRDTQYKEVRSEFTISLNASLTVGSWLLPIGDDHAKMAKWKPIEYSGAGSTVGSERDIYDLGEVRPLGSADHEGTPGSPFLWLFLLLIGVIAMAAIYAYVRRMRKRRAAPPQVG
jgi:hypothetical protein